MTLPNLHLIFEYTTFPDSDGCIATIKYQSEIAVSCFVRGYEIKIGTHPAIHWGTREIFIQGSETERNGEILYLTSEQAKILREIETAYNFSFFGREADLENIII